jgi:DNA-directed RNA polymerase specialized sigma24 family protein
MGWASSILARIDAGHSDALLELRRRLGVPVFHRAYGITGDAMAATLVVAGVFMLVWRRPRDFDVDDLEASLLSLADRRAHQWLASATGSTVIEPTVRAWQRSQDD